MQQSLPFDQTAATPTEPAQTGDFERAVIPEFVRHPRARRYVVRVRGDGTVRVTIPRWGSKREAAAFAEQQRGWIKKQLARLHAERHLPREQFSEDERRAFRVRAERPHLPELAAGDDAGVGTRLRDHPRADAPETSRSLAEILEARGGGLSGLPTGAHLAAEVSATLGDGLTASAKASARIPAIAIPKWRLRILRGRNLECVPK